MLSDPRTVLLSQSYEFLCESRNFCAGMVFGRFSPLVSPSPVGSGVLGCGLVDGGPGPVVEPPGDRRSLTMLVITRREGEEVVIGDPRNPVGVVRVAGIRGDRVRLAFDFPREIDVHRREVAQQILAGEKAPTADTPSIRLAT